MLEVLVLHTQRPSALILMHQADENVGEEELFAVGPGAATADSTPPRRSAAAAASDGELGAKVTTPAAADPGASLLSDHEQADALLDVSPAQNGSAAGMRATGCRHADERITRLFPLQIILLAAVCRKLPCLNFETR